MKNIQYQQKAVSELVEKTIGLLSLSGNRHTLVFKAPTGSGKTVMASDMLMRLNDELTERPDAPFTEVAYIWIAPNKLHEQSYFKMKNYFTETKILRPMIYDELDHSIEVLFNGESSVYPQYMRAMSERGQLEGSKIANQYLMASIGMENLGKDKIKSIYTNLIDDMASQKRAYQYSFGPFANLTEEERSRGVSVLNSINQLNADTEAKTKQFTEAMNKSIDLGIDSLSELMNLQIKIASGLPISENESINLIKNLTGYDLSQKGLGYHVIAPSGDIVYEDKEGAATTARSVMSSLRKLGAKGWFLNPLISALGEIKELFNMSELQTTKDIRTEGDLSEGDIGYGGAYSGVGKTKGTQPKVITINIQSLIGSVNINSTNGEDMETLKDKVTQVLIDAIKDFEISYN